MIVTSTDADEVLLDRFRTNMLPLFPFVVISPHTSASELESKKPFLFSCIKMIASVNNTRSMQAQMYHIMKHISDNMILRSERSLDLLQGLVVTLGWYHHHCVMHGQMNNLMQLATSLLGDLGLNRHALLPERTRILVLNPLEPSPRTNEDRRIMLGVWYLSSW